MVGKAERGPETVASIAKHRSAYLIAVGGAAFLVSNAIRGSRVVAFPELGMEAVYEFDVKDMPVTVAVSADGESVHETGPKKWAGKFAGIPVAVVESAAQASSQRLAQQQSWAEAGFEGADDGESAGRDRTAWRESFPRRATRSSPSSAPSRRSVRSVFVRCPGAECWARQTARRVRCRHHRAAESRRNRRWRHPVPARTRRRRLSVPAADRWHRDGAAMRRDRLHCRAMRATAAPRGSCVQREWRGGSSSNGLYPLATSARPALGVQHTAVGTTVLPRYSFKCRRALAIAACMPPIRGLWRVLRLRLVFRLLTRLL